ncbi:hypothetical protein [Commensalibacter oyaizuii]|uniref:Peptidase metallopeptidase domain-containing protein n=1 Tax=Commensalibacter oyaizuii TaxID=3043873 RepID=A0ABT6Q032_9PROT|nr:hypothetical protein [Commensalibacter sp. TBRC 16381]MDI2090463.1 hypothetical protein [Commensalibacter sp. TBRC 16381]
MEAWQRGERNKFSGVPEQKNSTTKLQSWQREAGKFSAEGYWSKENTDLKDYDEEVKINTTDVFRKGLVNGKYSDSEARTQWTAHYRMIIPLKTKGKVLIKMTFEMSKIGDGVTDQDIEKTKQFILNINKIWNGNFTLQVTDTRNMSCNPIRLPIEFDIQFAYKGEKIINGERHPHKIELYKQIPIIHGTKLRPRLEKGKTFLLETDPSVFSRAYTYAHEFGHALGLPDEYGYDPITDSYVQYHKSDGSLDKTKYLAFHEGKNRLQQDPQENIMSVFDSCKITERQGWVLGIAAKKVLDDSRYRCEFFLTEVMIRAIFV